MTNNLLIIIGAFAISMLCGFVLIPVILNFCKARGLYDIPNKRKMHKTKVPRLGGISFIPCMVFSFIIATTTLDVHETGHKIAINLWVLYFMVSLITIYIVGIIDDLIGLGARIKFSAQILAAMLLPAAGLYINHLYGFLGIQEIPVWLGVPLTVLAIVFIDNATNLIDGIDGLAASLSLLALLGFLYGFLCLHLYAYCILIAGLAGVLIAYLYFNLFGKEERNRKIFMGDSGSLTLGFILGFLFVKYIMVNPDVTPYRPGHLVFAGSLLLIPIFDVAWVILYRLQHHKPLFQADKNHIHHKLMQAGLSMHQSLIVIVALAVAFLVLNMVAFPLIHTTGVIVTDTVLYALFHLLVDRCITRRELG